MQDNDRPDPDALLARLAQEEGSSPRGRLRVFFGANAGVGKTYAMLESARERQAEGVDVVVGHVMTHGRPETAALLDGLPALAPRTIVYRGRTLQEFDLDAALARRPQILLVDELAHTNVPGSRHERRYQDVEELLQAGIDVHTTLNVQHLESLNDLVAQVTGVVVRETVPDSVLETADEVELIDLPPDELLTRLREGKVYVPEQAERAIASFFKRANLIALRELALRATADRVDEQMQVYRRAEAGARSWPITEKILVCVSPSPSAKRVVRAGRRLARRLRAQWTALYVEQPRHARLPRADRELAARALRLAQQLGGETVTLAAHDAVEDILRFARAHNYSKIVVGHPGRYWRARELLAGSFVARLARASGDLDVFIVHGEGESGTDRAATASARPSIDWKRVAQGLGIVALATVVAAAMFPFFDLSNLIMVYLLGVVVVASRWGRGPAIAAAITSVATFDFLFVPPYLTFAVADTQYVVTFVVMLIVGVLIGTLTFRIREHAEVARRREWRTNALYSLSRELASTRNLDAMIAAVRRHLGDVFGGDAAVFLSDEQGRLALRPGAAPPFAADPKELAVAQWVHEHSQLAGRGTSTLSGATALHLPLVGGRRPVGVLAVEFGTGEVSHAVATDVVHLLETFANQTALALERAILAREAHRQRMAAEGEHLRNTLLAAVSHDLRTPLATITGAAGSLAASDDRLDPAARRELILTIHEEAERVSRLATNLLEMGRIQAQGPVLRVAWQPLEEVLGAALRPFERHRGDREIVLRVAADLPLVEIDDVLMERVLVNLLDNAVRHTPAGTPIELAAYASRDHLTVEVLDRGPGLAPGDEHRIFTRFFQGESPGPRSGVGLGLAVARAIVEAHGGRIWAENRSGGGAAFRFTLPIREAPVIRAEPE